jgi:Tfp pilus assembly protein FimT
MQQRLARNGERGGGLLEYLFVVSLIAVVCLIAVTFFGNQNNGSMQKSANTIATSTAHVG